MIAACPGILMFVTAFDGGNAAGKETIIRAISARIGNAVIIKSPPPSFLPELRRGVDGNAHKELLNSLLYYEMASLAVESGMRRISEKNPDSVVLMDRSIISTEMSHLAIDSLRQQGEPSQRQRITESIASTSKQLRRPDLAVFVQIDPDPRVATAEKHRRLSTSRSGQVTKADLDDEKEVAEMWEYALLAPALRASGMSVLQIYTLGRTPEDEAEEIIREMRRLGLVRSSGG